MTLCAEAKSLEEEVAEWLGALGTLDMDEPEPASSSRTGSVTLLPGQLPTGRHRAFGMRPGRGSGRRRAAPGARPGTWTAQDPHLSPAWWCEIVLCCKVLGQGQGQRRDQG